MLTEKTINIVKTTAPVLENYSQEIGERFYSLLFLKVPSLGNIFNQSNQKRGIQQGALAKSVYVIGAHVDQLESIRPMLKKIAQKHRALGVEADQYLIVGQTLLEAVKDVLGDVATEEIIEAWGAAYNEIAHLFIEMEKELYKGVEQQVGGWIDTRPFVVAKKVKESSVITSFYLTPQDGQPLPTFKPGQYITIKAEIDGEIYTHMRHYSLSDAPDKDYYRISVKREDAHDGNPNGVVSTYLHNKTSVGDTLLLTAPAGDFILKEPSRPTVFISGGVGITPMISMVKSLLQGSTNTEITFIHAAQNGDVHGMKEEIQSWAELSSNIRSYVCYSNPTEQDRQNNQYDKEGYIDLEWMQSLLAHYDHDFYICGPQPFMEAINELLKKWGVPDERRMNEWFTPNH
ncbi:NO-inducible flavohemoprotein [Alkalihalobacillus trypoxylicola]|uniref:Flavohemoprotein n=1 Tax=Alkalihalobacillus trypoxylicola TaxID=519424 RepID=A0A161PJH7_9BACI|nr:NO-inducible flavohemoprotein [Alkalihalobacillus trypoxylicola]KYG29451.1 nitric oxide dioxygenase [Alkalihalobacillus trypoxylicola]